MLDSSMGSAKTSTAPKTWLQRIYPFNAEQTVNILSEFGPLVTMFVVNAAAGITWGTWALLISTVIAMVTMRMVVGRLPVFPLIASSVTLSFGALTLLTGDPMWVQIKVTIFNAMFAGFLFGGLASLPGKYRSVATLSTVVILAVGAAWLFVGLAMAQPTRDVFVLARALMESASDIVVPRALPTDALCVATVLIGYLVGRYFFRRNFFQYSFEKTFHYTETGWSSFTFSFAWFFVLTAVLNELVRQFFVDTQMYNVFGVQMDGVNIWIAFKIAIIMPLSGLFAWYLTQVLQKHKMPDDKGDSTGSVGAEHIAGRPAMKMRPAE
jgi:intracellular septation protein A